MNPTPARARSDEQALLTLGPPMQGRTALSRNFEQLDNARYHTVAKPSILRAPRAWPLGGVGRGANITIATVGLIMGQPFGATTSDAQMLAEANVLWLGSTTRPTGSECLPWSQAREASVSSGPLDRQLHERLLTAPVADLSRDALAMLSINKSQMAGILGIERPHFYQWLKGGVTQPHKAGRLRDLIALLCRSGVTTRDPLRSHLLTEPLEPGATPLLTQLAGDIKHPALASALLRAISLNRTIAHEAEQRAARMQAAGHANAQDAEAQATFDQTMTMVEWDNA
jgi:hypothetical protein